MNMIRRIFRHIERIFLSRNAYKFIIRDWVELNDLKMCAAVVGTMRFSRNLEPLLMDGPKAKRILVLAPHPNDEIHGPGGTLLKSLRNGATVRVLYLTSANSDLAKKEAEKVSGEAGYEMCFLYDFPVHHIPLNAESLGILADEVNGFGPQVVMLPFLFDDHDDHRRASHLLFECCKRHAIDRKIEIWAYQVYTALVSNVVVDITEEAEKKASLLRMFKTRMKIRDLANFTLGLNAFNSRFLREVVGKVYAECFFVVSLKEYEHISGIYFGRGPQHCYYSQTYLS